MHDEQSSDSILIDTITGRGGVPLFTDVAYNEIIKAIGKRIVFLEARIGISLKNQQRCQEEAAGLKLDPFNEESAGENRLRVLRRWWLIEHHRVLTNRERVRIMRMLQDLIQQEHAFSKLP